MKLQTDPKVVAKLAEEREDANWRFRTFLKGIELEIEELDAIVHRHYEYVASQIDCCACGNCCREILPTLDDADVSRLATGLETTPDEIVTQYLTRDEEGELTFNRRPCPFLSGEPLPRVRASPRHMPIIPPLAEGGVRLSAGPGCQ